MSLIGKAKSFCRFSAADRSQTGRSVIEHVIDLIQMARHRLSPEEYYSLQFYNGVPRDYLSVRDYERIERVLNPRKTGVIAFDKWHQFCFFKALGLPTPHVFGFISGRRGMFLGKLYSGDPHVLLDGLADIKKPIVTKPYGGGTVMASMC